MSGQLDNIICLSSDDRFDSRLKEIRQNIMRLSAFDCRDERSGIVRDIFADVAERGDEAVAEYTEKFDGVSLKPEQFKITQQQLKKAGEEIDPQLLTALKKAIENVRKYQADVFTANNKQNLIKYTPIKKVGICVPGASAPLPSTVIMTAVPAQVAGVEQIIVVSPPRFNGNIHPVILGLCYELGITDVYRIGGVQAVAAMTFGTTVVPNVHKIVGPGNQWVQSAKRQAFGYVGIDSIAGPSEVLIIADSQARPAWVAADMLSQAEHAPASAVVFTDSQELAEKILDELKEQVKLLTRAKEAVECLEKFSAIVTFENMDEVIKCANDFASEHLEIHCGNQSRQVAEKIDNAGAVFIGEYSPVAIGDYWAGPSHTLPTGQGAKFFSALSANDFVKSTSIIEYDKAKLMQSADDIIRIAETEGLDAHAKSIKIRLGQ